MKTPSQTQRSRRETRGQGMTEYVIMVSLIAVATIGVITLFGDNIRKVFGAASDSIAGNDNVANRAVASTQGAIENKSMRNFAENNAY